MSANESVGRVCVSEVLQLASGDWQVELVPVDVPITFGADPAAPQHSGHIDLVVGRAAWLASRLRQGQVCYLTLSSTQPVTTVPELAAQVKLSALTAGVAQHDAVAGQPVASPAHTRKVSLVVNPAAQLTALQGKVGTNLWLCLSSQLPA